MRRQTFMETEIYSTEITFLCRGIQTHLAAYLMHSRFP